MAQVQTQRPTGSGKKKAVAIAVLLVVVIASVAIGIAVMTSSEPQDDGDLQSPYTPGPQPSTVDPAIITSVTLGTDGNVVVSFEHSNPSFVPTYKLYRAGSAFTTVAAATYIKTVIDPSEKNMVDRPPSGTWFYGVIVAKPLGVGLGYAFSPMSGTMSVVVGSTGPGTTPDPITDPEPEPQTVIAAPVLLSASPISEGGTFTLTLFIDPSNDMHVYLSTAMITESDLATTFFKTVYDYTFVNGKFSVVMSIPGGVQPDTKYHVAARAVTSTSISPLSNVMETNSPASTPPPPAPILLPGTPTSFGFSYASSCQCVFQPGGSANCYCTMRGTVNWDAPTSDGGSPITEYRIYNFYNNANGVLLATVAPTARTHTFVMSANGVYKIGVKAVTAAGESIEFATNQVTYTVSVDSKTMVLS